jgi:hypothetical protein
MAVVHNAGTEFMASSQDRMNSPEQGLDLGTRSSSDHEL